MPTVFKYIDAGLPVWRQVRDSLPCYELGHETPGQLDLWMGETDCTEEAGQVEKAAEDT